MAQSPKPEPWTFLRRARLRAGLTSTDAAREIGVSLTHYCNVEKGRDGFSDKTLIRTAVVYQVDVEALDASRPVLVSRTAPLADVA